MRCRLQSYGRFAAEFVNVAEKVERAHDSLQNLTLQLNAIISVVELMHKDDARNMRVEQILMLLSPFAGQLDDVQETVEKAHHAGQEGFY